MLIRSDIVPLPCGGRYVVARRPDPVDAGQAVAAIARGEHVAPADVATAELLADRLRRAGNVTRADMLLRTVGAPLAPEEPEAPEPQEPSSEPPEPPQDDQHADAALDIKALVEAAGDDLTALQRLAHAAGVKPKRTWGAQRLRDEVFSAVAKRVAEGKPALKE